MKDNIAKFKKLTRDFTAILKKEKAAIKDRKFEEIGEYESQKSAMMADFDALAPLMNANEVPKDLIDELNTVRKQAEENAVLLAAVAKGVKRARMRLHALDKNSRNAGLYGPGGEKLEGGKTGTLNSKA